MVFLRSFLFNVLFYSITAITCLVLLPILFFLPRQAGLFVARIWVGVAYLLEKFILGLHYEVRGLEHLPKDGPYIVAAKHQSAYETLKLHRLFADPSIVLKKELTEIPFWGHFLKKVDVIAIDRSTPDMALSSMLDGARRMKDQGRPIIIFPQGTRVPAGVTPKEKRYKNGVAKIYEATQIPIIPMALNSGLFWSKNAFLKYPGTVVFEFLPPIPPGRTKESVMQTIEQEIERASERLTQDAAQTFPYLPYAQTKEWPQS